MLVLVEVYLLFIFIYLFLCAFNLQLVKLDLCLRIKILKYVVKYLILHPINIDEEWTIQNNIPIFVIFSNLSLNCSNM